jgi:hypothetical protein
MSAKTTKNDLLDSTLDVKAFPFFPLIGKLLYCANMTRSDISAALSHLSCHMSSPICRH